MTKQRLYLEKRNKIATEKLPALIKEKDGLTQQLSASKERIKQLEQQLAAASAKDKPEKPALAALGEQEHQLTDEEMQLIAKLGALQKQAGEESDTLLFDKKLFIFCSEKIQELCKKTIKDPKDLLSEVEILTKIMKTTKTIEDTLNTRGDSTSKAKALTIHQAMNEIDVVKRKDLLKIKDLKPGQEFAAAQKFVDGLLIQRAILFKTTEAASFTLFKKEMEAIQPLVEAKKPSKPR